LKIPGDEFNQCRIVDSAGLFMCAAQYEQVRLVTMTTAIITLIESASGTATFVDEAGKPLSADAEQFTCRKTCRHDGTPITGIESENYDAATGIYSVFLLFFECLHAARR
jgi:hypothetical protein